MDFANYFDVIIVVMVLILALKGLFNGFIRECCSCVGIIGGVLIASRCNTIVGEWINSIINIESQTLVNLFGFMVILAFIWILALVVAEIIIKFAHFIKLGTADKILGIVMAGIKIFLVLSVIFFTFSKINFLDNFTSKLEDSSYLYPIMIKIGDSIIKTDFATEIRTQAVDSVNNGLKELQQTIDTQVSGANNKLQEAQQVLEK